MNFKLEESCLCTTWKNNQGGHSQPIFSPTLFDTYKYSPANLTVYWNIPFGCCNIVIIILGVLTCLCKPSLSSSDRTQPTLPSPPQTRIRKVSNFWKRRSLNTHKYDKNTICVKFTQPIKLYAFKCHDIFKSCCKLDSTFKLLFWLRLLQLSSKKPHFVDFDINIDYCFTKLLIDTAVCDQWVWISPQLRAAVHEVEHLRRVQELLKPAQELNALIIAALTVHQHQQRTRAGRTRGLPEACGRGMWGMMKEENEIVGEREEGKRTWEGCHVCKCNDIWLLSL